MKCPPKPPDELYRLAALSEYGLGPDRALPSLDPVVELTARVFGMPIAAVDMIGTDQVFLAACYGISTEGVDMSRDVSFCVHTVNQNDVMVVSDTTLDDRFHDNPLVIGPAQLRFYAGVPLRSPGGYALGTLCVFDFQPRKGFSAADRVRLLNLAQMATDRLELRRIEVMSERRAHGPLDADALDSATAVAWFDPSGSVVAGNRAAAQLFGYEVDSLPGMPVEALVAPSHRPMVAKLVARAVAAATTDGLVMPRRLTGLRRDGSEFALGISLFRWSHRRRLLFNVHLQDMTARIRRRDERLRLVSTDSLTGLSNRRSFYKQLEQALVSGAEASLLILDLDGFKDINDTLGQQVGDRVLCAVAQRLQAQLDGQGLVSRIGGDEFAVLVMENASQDAAEELGRRLVACIAEAINIDGSQMRIDACCGLALAPAQAMEAVELIGNADLALAHAKKISRGSVFTFVDSLRVEAEERRLHGIELHRAVHEGEFVLFYQPQFRLGDGALVGAEALLRWNHPQRGWLSPAAFLPALEAGPLAVVVGSWVLDEACAQAAYWRRHGAEGFRIGVNLFGAQMRRQDLVSEVASTLHRHGLPPDALELEVTENIVLDREDHALAVMRRLRALGVGIAFDDFGTGYAALNVFKKYPLTRIKIDRLFVQAMNESVSDSTLVRAIVDMAHGFGLATTAEGIENDEQRIRLLSFGCEDGQGYLFGRPVSAADFASMFAIGVNT